MTKLMAVLGLLLVSFYTGHFVSATEETNVTSEKQQAPVSTQVSRQSQLVESNSSARTAYLDPKTGKLTSQSRSPVPNNQTQQADGKKPIKYTTYANGTVGATLEGRFLSQLTATIGCDGSVNTEHTEELASEPTECEAP